MSQHSDSAAAGFFVLAPGDTDAADLLIKHVEAGGGRGSFVGIGRSMEPTLLAGDRVQIRQVSGGLLEGWVVVFSWRGQILTHRVIRVHDQEFWARGDACLDAEGPVPVDQVIGRVEGYWREDQWHDLSGRRQQVLGLAYNRISSRARRLVRRLPGLKRIVELDAVRMIGGWVYGDICTREDIRVERVVGALVSDAVPLTQRLVVDVEKHLAKGNLNLLVALSPRFGRVGHVLLSRVEPGVGCLTSLQVSLGARGLGVDRLLLDAAEASARSRGWKTLLAPPTPGNQLHEAVYYSQGFRPVDGMLRKSLGKA